MAVPRLVMSVFACTVGLAFWWALTEPLAFPLPALYAVPALILLGSGVIAGRMGVLAAPISLLFSLFLGSLIATWLHQAFVPETAPVSHFGAQLVIEPVSLIAPLVAAAVCGVLGGFLGERMLPTRAEWPGQRRR
ncbi:MAG: hypothetical protein KGN00_08055 [Chloroflexota bacterium]|nr:hypothetical protein [Chloroflexota bacterium]